MAVGTLVCRSLGWRDVYNVLVDAAHDADAIRVRQAAIDLGLDAVRDDLNRKSPVIGQR